MLNVQSSAVLCGDRGVIEGEQLALDRAAVYQFVADQVVWAPDDQGRTAAQLALQWQAHLDIIDPAGVERVRAILLDPQLDWPALNAAFSSLLVVRWHGYLAPMESVYQTAALDDGRWHLGRMHGRPCMQVQAAYRAAGFELAPGTRVHADHLGCELEFLAFLCRGEAAAWARSDVDAVVDRVALQAEFFSAHPAAWLPKVQDRLRDLEPHPYFVQLFETIARFFEIERIHLEAAEA